MPKGMEWRNEDCSLELWIQNHMCLSQYLLSNLHTSICLSELQGGLQGEGLPVFWDQLSENPDTPSALTFVG